MPDAPISSDGITLLRLHTGPDGFVWAGDDAQLAVNTRCPAHRFFESDVLAVPWANVKAVRLLGTPRNAALICHIQQRRAADPTLLQSQRIYLVAPQAAGGRLDDPAAVLQVLWQPETTDMLYHQRHQMTPSDFCVYGMILETEKAGGTIPEVVRRIVRFHPAWPAASFVASLKLDYACALLNAIVDPRWFIHSDRPNRLSRLYAYLGLSLENVNAVMVNGPGGYNHNRALLTVKSWYDPETSTGERPEDFLWRTCLAAPDRVRGVLRATKRFVSLLSTYWLCHVGAAHPEAGFRPELFFHAPDEIQAFTAHAKKMKKNV